MIPSLARKRIVILMTTQTQTQIMSVCPVQTPLHVVRSEPVILTSPISRDLAENAVITFPSSVPRINAATVTHASTHS